MNILLVQGLAFFCGVGSIACVAYYFGKWRARRQNRANPPTVSASFDAERITRLELAVDALAVELERIGEGQRYTVKLLDERLPRRIAAGRPAQPGEGGRVTTPH